MTKTNNAASAGKASKATKTNNNVTPAPAPAETTPAVRPSAADAITIAAALIKEYRTLSAIKAQYKALCDKYTKDGYTDIIKNASTIRYAEIDDAAANVAAAVTYDGQLLAAYDSARTAADWPRLCAFVGLASIPTDADKAARMDAARAFIAAYYKDVDTDGQPLRRCWYVNASGNAAYMTYIPARQTATTAAALFLAAVNGTRKAARAGVRYCKDNETRKAAHVRTIGGVYASADAITKDVDGVTVLCRTAEQGKDGQPLSAAAVKTKYAAVSVCDASGNAAADFTPWVVFAADWRKDNASGAE